MAIASRRTRIYRWWLSIDVFVFKIVFSPVVGECFVQVHGPASCPPLSPITPSTPLLSSSPPVPQSFPSASCADIEPFNRLSYFPQRKNNNLTSPNSPYPSTTASRGTDPLLKYPNATISRIEKSAVKTRDPLRRSPPAGLQDAVGGNRVGEAVLNLLDLSLTGYLEILMHRKSSDRVRLCITWDYNGMVFPNR